MLRNGVSTMRPWTGMELGEGEMDMALAAAVRATLAPRLCPKSTKRVRGEGG